jgi:protocatechuate 3,4-dioxygenase beta subunit
MMGTCWFRSIRPNTVRTVRYRQKHLPGLRRGYTRVEVVLLEDRCLPSALSGQVFNDLNGNGTKEMGELGLSGATVFLDANNNGVLDTSETSTATDFGGNYSFANLPAGTYRVREMVPASWLRTSGNPADIVLGNNSTLTVINFGNLNLAPTNRITGRAFNDLNDNATQDPGEPVLSGVTIFLDANSNGVRDPGETSTLTDASGNYTFANRPGGTYQVREVVPTGFVQATLNPADLVVSSGSTMTGVNFGNFNVAPTNRISGRVFVEIDGTPGLGLPGMTVFLDSNHNGVLDFGETSTVTDASGNYSFANLPGGTYRVREVIPASGVLQTTANPADIVVSSGSTIGGINFGNALFLGFAGTFISGRAYNDFNLNGTLDSGEPGLPGVTLFLDSNNNGVLDPGETSTVTDTSGNYSLSTGGPGTYRVREIPPANYALTVANPAVIVISNSSVSNVNFGNRSTVPTNHISGQVFNDLNSNGTQDPSEPGLPGVTVFLDLNYNSVRDPGEPSAISDDSGNYSLTNVAFGLYRVREVLPSGFVATTPNPALTIVSNGTNPRINFGNYSTATTNRITGFAFNDPNFNGTPDAGEPGLSGLTIFLDTNNNGVLDPGELNTTTDVNGNYSFANLGSGAYRVREVVPPGFVPTTANPVVIIVFGGKAIDGVNFGNFSIVPTNRISGQVFNDFNDNGSQETGEPGLSSLTLFLDNNNNGELDPGETSTTTDASGNYSFASLAIGAYRVREVVPAGFALTVASPPVLVVGSSSTITGINFGNFSIAPTNRISGQAFNDLNFSGLEDTGEPGLPGLTVFLDSNRNGVLDPGEPSTLTDASGNYSFANLAAGTYAVRELVPAGLVPTSADPAVIDVSGGSTITGINFGNFSSAPANRLGGRAFNDLNSNGIQDTVEPGLSGWTIFLDTNNNGVVDTGEPSTHTDSTGNYVFTNLVPGPYRVREVVPTGFVLTTTTNPVVLVVSNSMTGVNFGNFNLTPTNRLSGRVFNDLHGNGTQDTSGPGLSDWIIFLDTNNNGVLDTTEPSTLTDANGNYSFANLPGGTYRVHEVISPSFVQTTVNPADLVVSNGSTLDGVNFGNFSIAPTNPISGRAFNDLNNNGTLDSGEPGLPGVTIFLDANNNGMLDNGEPSTLTDANGNYSFANLPVGTYGVRELVPLTYVTTTANFSVITLSSGSSYPAVNFGNFGGNRISGRAFTDLNYNGVLDAEEPGLPGVTIFLDANGNFQLDAGEVSSTTDSNGNYSFTNLPAGTYRVRAVTPTGFFRTTSNPADSVVSNGSILTGVNFGNYSVAATNRLSGRAFNDLNFNGIQDSGEPGLPGLTVFLDTNNNGVLDGGETNTTTDASGNYSFSNLAAGTYRVREVVPAGFVATTDNPVVLPISGGSTLNGINFGNFNTNPTNRISGQAYNDLNFNGIQDAGDPGLPGMTVFLDTNNNGVLDGGEPSTTTDASGNYSFSNLTPGTYAVHEVVPAGFVPSTANPVVLAVSSSSTVSGVKFGNFNISPTDRISGLVYSDLNSNGIQDSNEPGLPGVTVFLDGNSNGVLDPGEMSLTTDSSGNYSFTNLASGSYRVRERVPAGWVLTSGSSAVSVFGSGSTITGVTFGNFNIAAVLPPSNRISGQVYNDLNFNGTPDSGEPGLSGLTVFLDSNNNGALDPGEMSTLTDASGNYRFTNLPVGTYRVREAVPASGVLTSANPTPIVLANGSISTGVTFGNFRLAPANRISGQVFNDLNANGTKDPGEPGLPGVLVFLDGNNNAVLDPGEISTLTDANGNYSFTNLVAGTYQVREVVPTGLVPTTANPAVILVSGDNRLGSIDFGNFRAGGSGSPGAPIAPPDSNNTATLDTGETITTTDALTTTGARVNNSFPSQPVEKLHPKLVDEVFARRSRSTQTDALARSLDADALFDEDLAVLLMSPCAKKLVLFTALSVISGSFLSTLKIA